MKITQRIPGLILTALMLAFSVNVFAQPNSRHRSERRGQCMFKHQMHGVAGVGGLARFADELGLSDDQMEKLKTLRFETAKKTVAERSEVQIAGIELHELMQKDDFDESAIKKQIEKIGRLKTNMMLTRVDKKLAVKNVLTDEQENMLKELRRESFKRSKRGDRKGRRGFGLQEDESEGYFFGGVDKDFDFDSTEAQDL